MYFPCCRSKSVSHENLHEDGGRGVGGTPGRARRPNPIVVGLANHLREHHSSARNSAMAGCFGFPDSPPRYEDIYVEATRSGLGVSRRNNHSRNSHHNQQDEGGICNVSGGAKQIMAEEEGITPPPELEDDEAPPPSYEESVGMSSSTNIVMRITIEKENLKENFT